MPRSWAIVLPECGSVTFCRLGARPVGDGGGRRTRRCSDRSCRRRRSSAARRSHRRRSRASARCRHHHAVVEFEHTAHRGAAAVLQPLHLATTTTRATSAIEATIVSVSITTSSTRVLQRQQRTRRTAERGSNSMRFWSACFQNASGTCAFAGYTENGEGGIRTLDGACNPILAYRVGAVAMCCSSRVSPA